MRTQMLSSSTDRAAIFLSYGLSLSLFGLTILEALPVSTQTLLSHQRTLVSAYWTTLWLLSIYILLVVPGLVGASAANSLRHFFCSARSPITSLFDSAILPWWIRFALRLAFGLIFIVLKYVFSGIFWCCSGLGQNAIDSLVLPVREESIPSSQSEDIQDNSSHETPNSSSSTRKKYVYFQNIQTSRLQILFATLGGISGIILVMGIFSTIGPLVVEFPSTHQPSILLIIASRICALGLLMSSILNGFGSVSLPYTTLSGFFLEVRPEYVTNVESDLKKIREILTEKEGMLKELKVQIPTQGSFRSKNQPSPTEISFNTFFKPSLLTKNSSSHGFLDLGVELRKRRQNLIIEIAFLEDLIQETTLDLEELKYSQMTAAAARTPLGKVKSYVGFAFSVILLIRLFNAGFFVFRSYSTSFSTHHAPHLHTKSRSDVVTSILLWITGRHHISHHRFNTLSQIVSLILSAVLSFTQVTNFFRTATSVHRHLSRFWKRFVFGGEDTISVNPLLKNHSFPDSRTNNLWHVTSALMGCYSLACIVLIKMMLPERFSIAFSMALYEVSIFTIHTTVINGVFFSSAVVSASILGILLGIQRQNIAKHADILSHRGTNIKGASLPDV